MSIVFGLIPARSGSKGVPHKNIANLGGHSLIDWSIKACKRAKLIDRIIVSTDSEEYAKIALNMGAEVPFLRPADISGDNSTDFDFIKHLLDWFELNDNLPDYIAHIRPTTPFRDPELIDAAIKLFISNPQYTALRSVQLMSESAYKAFEINNSGDLKMVGSDNLIMDYSNNPRQKFPNTYVANGYIDVLSVQHIRKESLIHGKKVMPFITPQIIELDTKEDFDLLQLQLLKSQEIKDKIFN